LDAEAFDKIFNGDKEVEAELYPNLYGWLLCVGQFSDEVRKSWGAPGAASAKKGNAEE